MKNIHVLPTDKPSRLCIRDFDNKLCLHTDEVTYHGISQHIYITNDEETKLKDWFISSTLVLKATDILDCDDDGKLEIHSDGYCNPLSLVKIIILTTDQDLIKDGVQAIDDEFLEWFVKNPSCEMVEIEKQYITPLGDIVETCYDNERLNYKIIIPKEETTQELERGITITQVGKQETLEEAFDRIFDSLDYILFDFCSFEQGAKWQKERSYSEEEMKLAFNAGKKRGNSGYPNTDNFREPNFEEFMEQFKNK